MTTTTSKQKEAIRLAISLIKDGTLKIDSEYKIWRCKILNNGKIVNIAPRPIESPSVKGYMIFTIFRGGIIYNLRSHRVIWVLLKGPIPDGLQINHKDLNKANNHIDNLELVTPRENTRHAILNGHTPVSTGKNNGKRKPRTLTPERIEAINSLSGNNFSAKTISKQVGLSLSYTYKQLAKIRASTA